MAKIILTENEFRKYIRSLIREARPSFGYEPSVENGTFNLDHEIHLPGARTWFANYFDKDHPKPRKVHGDGCPDRIINYDTRALANQEEINKFISDRRAQAYEKRKEKERGRHLGNKLSQTVDSKAIKKAVLNANTKAKINKLPRRVGGYPNDQYTEKWVQMSPQEQGVAKKKIKRGRLNRQNAEYNKPNAATTSFQQPNTRPSYESTLQRLQNVRKELKQMGDRTEKNAKKYDELTSVKNDCLRIIHYYYQDKTPTARRKYELNGPDKMALDAAKADIGKDPDLKLFDFDFPNKDFGYNYYYDGTEDDRPLRSDFKNY